jgi:hypothetical protein
MLSRQEEERERRETLENDRKVLEAERQRIAREGTTLHRFAQSQADELSGGRFAAINPTTVVGSDPTLKYPPLPSSSPWSGAQPEPGVEPQLGYEINRLTPYELEPSMGTTRPVEDTGGAPSSAPPDDVAAPPPSSKGSDDGRA